ncbi:hypothetical protein CROQUDRAFT_87969 [Cronartium quercuum f. sp. fusiforme G11]|uniref:Uncharacterized protein n=1 Tax=Cronartium quercuum f. sp. fusiforme G11 TaxID=708437 RepID=A0A9P6NRS5_9BASI|nr:hypothetical protein CROQUDRAFT_87969 [Cronartium quercuum f. sp. fusiforme G11]
MVQDTLRAKSRTSNQIQWIQTQSCPNRYLGPFSDVENHDWFVNSMSVLASPKTEYLKYRNEQRCYFIRTDGREFESV